MCQSASPTPRSAHCTPLRRMAPFVSLHSIRDFWLLPPDMSHAHLLRPSPSRCVRSVKPLPYSHVPSHRPDLRPSARASFPRRSLFTDQTLQPPADAAASAASVRCIRSGHITPLQPCGAPRGESLSYAASNKTRQEYPHFHNPVRQRTRGPSPMLKGPACVHGTHHIPTAMRQGIGACLHKNRQQLPQA